MDSISPSVAPTTSPVFNPQLTGADLILTDAARDKMVELFEEVDDEVNAIRVFVAGGGCGGMSYGMTFTDQQFPTDCVLHEGRFSVYVDVVAMGFLRGVEIDFVDRGPGGASFVFNNAFAATGGGGGCPGCGSSSR